jgi:hypothetical protein
MIYRFLIYIATLGPFIGVLIMDNGGYGTSINQLGHENGATSAFLLYLILFFAVVLFVTNTKRVFFNFQIKSESHYSIPEDRNFFPMGILCLAVMCVFTAFTLFSMGGWDVLLGRVGKGHFRVSLGDFGPVGYLILKYYAPGVFAFACLKFLRSDKNRTDKILLALIACMLILLSFGWGFKSGAILALLPALILIFWTSSLLYAIVFGIFSLLLLIFTYWLFDSTNIDFEFSRALIFMFERLTVMQGDVPWKIWDLYSSDFAFPDYKNTLLPVLGDRVFSAFTGITIEQPYEWIMAHFGLMLTYLTGYPIAGIIAGHNITGTPFSEGLIAAGFVGMILFSLISGFAVGLVYLVLDHVIRAGSDKVAAAIACYSVMAVIAWVLGGGILSMVHISVIFGVLTTIAFLHMLELAVKFKYRFDNGKCSM